MGRVTATQASSWGSGQVLSVGGTGSPHICFCEVVWVPQTPRPQRPCLAASGGEGTGRHLTAAGQALVSPGHGVGTVQAAVRRILHVTPPRSSATEGTRQMPRRGCSRGETPRDPSRQGRPRRRPVSSLTEVWLGVVRGACPSACSRAPRVANTPQGCCPHCAPAAGGPARLFALPEQPGRRAPRRLGGRGGGWGNPGGPACSTPMRRNLPRMTVLDDVLAFPFDENCHFSM